MTLKQRETRNLGLNRSKDREIIFRHIETVMGIKEKFCSRGRSKNKSFAFSHDGPNPLPIRNFNLSKAFIDANGNVIIQSPDGLQANCMACEKKFRRRRINRYKEKYSKMSDKEIYSTYKKNYGRETKKCSSCGLEKKPSEFLISRSMETGLHNTCAECAKSYSESVGDRWAIYSPDGHQVLSIKKDDSCEVCSSKLKLHKDHIFPISKGGTDNIENLQVLCEKHNLSKSNTVKSEKISSVKDIHPLMVCERYRSILLKALKNSWSLVKFESEITKKVRSFIVWKSNLSDEKLLKFFILEKRRNNRKHSPERSLRKFREYQEKVVLNTSEKLSS